MISTAPIASLPMYDFAPLRAATDAWWGAIRARLACAGIAAPEALDRRADHAALWDEPGLVLSQTCGYPYVTRLRGRVRLVATPVYRAAGCEGARYRSALIVRADEQARTLAGLRGRRAAINTGDSQSGMNALRAAVAPLAAGGRFFASVIESGGHAASVRAVTTGEADVAAIDCVTWTHLAALDPGLAGGLRVLDFTASAPALPYVTAAARSDAEVAALRAALADAVADPALAEARAALLIEGFAEPDEGAYDEILEMERAALRLGYPALA